jgi:hypothetical protein
VVCPGAARFTDEQRKTMTKDDPRTHMGGGWYADEFPTNCPHCGDPAQFRSVHLEIDLRVA